MNILLMIIAISLFTLFGSFYAKRFNKPDGLIALYVCFVIISQIMASKIAVFDLGLTKVTAPAAVIVFSVTFLLTDIVNERFGKSQVYQMINITFVTQIALVLFLYIGGQLPSAPFWQNQNSWDVILGAVPRITFASLVTFLISERLDAWIYHEVNKKTEGKHLWARNVISTIPALTVDTIVFVLLAFAGTDSPIWLIMMGQFATKYTVGLINIPFMYLNQYVFGKRKNMDFSDT
jgi:queuosine precursor transporter